VGAVTLVALTLTAPPHTHSQIAPPLTPQPYTSVISGTYAQDIAVSPKGRWLFMVGSTTDPNYPVTADAYDRTCGSDGQCNPIQGRFGIERVGDVVFTVLDSAGQIRYSTFLGGSA
jgi:hypothetical protein